MHKVGAVILGIKNNYKLCKDCLYDLYPEIKITGITNKSSQTMTTKAKKKKLQEEVDAKLNYYLGG